MKIRFKYTKSVEYFLKTYSTIDIEGEGTWNVDEYELADEFSNSNCDDLDTFLDDYFWRNLDLDYNDCIVNDVDYQLLSDYIETFKNNFQEE